MSFLIDHFPIFLIVYAVVLLDTVLGILEALYNRKFNFAFVPDFIYTMLRYSLFLCFGNAIEYFATYSGVKIDGVGLYGIAFVILTVEGASIVDSIKKLPKRKEEFPQQNP